jgi:hypothetical protein
MLQPLRRLLSQRMHRRTHRCVPEAQGALRPVAHRGAHRQQRLRSHSHSRHGSTRRHQLWRDIRKDCGLLGLLPVLLGRVRAAHERGQDPDGPPLPSAHAARSPSVPRAALLCRSLSHQSGPGSALHAPCRRLHALGRRTCRCHLVRLSSRGLQGHATHAKPTRSFLPPPCSSPGRAHCCPTRNGRAATAATLVGR